MYNAKLKLNKSRRMLRGSDANGSLNLNTSINRSAYVRVTPIGADVGIQTDSALPDRAQNPICFNAFSCTKM